MVETEEKRRFGRFVQTITNASLIYNLELLTISISILINRRDGCC